jgi:hypothetical protein
MRLTPAILLIGGLALVACQRRAEPDARTHVITDGDVDWSLATHPKVPLSGNDIHDLVNRALTGSGRFIIGAGEGEMAARVRAQIISAEVTEPAGIELRMRLHFVPPLGDESSAIDAIGSGKAKGNPDEASRAAISMALSNALNQVNADLHGRGKSDQELVADLEGKDPAVADLAAERLAARRRPVVFAPLVDRLRSNDPDVAQRAVASLVSLDDQRAVLPIIEETEHRPLVFKLEALYAVGSLGGEEAEAYLFTLSSDPDARVKTAAAEALALAKRRTPK